MIFENSGVAYSAGESNLLPSLNPRSLTYVAEHSFSGTRRRCGLRTNSYKVYSKKQRCLLHKYNCDTQRKSRERAIVKYWRHDIRGVFCCCYRH